MSIFDEINNMVKSAQHRLGGTVFAQRRKNPVVANATTAQPGNVTSLGFGGTGASQARTSAPQAGTRGVATPPTTAATAQNPSAAQTKPQFNFEAEAKKIISPFVKDFRSRPGAYSDRARSEYNSMMAKMRQDLAGVRGGKMDEAAQRKLLQDWKNRVSGFKGWRKGDSLTVGQTPKKTNPYMESMENVGRGVQMRVSQPDPDRSAGYNVRAMRSRQAYDNAKRRAENDRLLAIADFAMDMSPEEYAGVRRGSTRRTLSPQQIQRVRNARLSTFERKPDTSFILSPQEDKAQWDALARERSAQFNKWNQMDGADPNEHNFQTWEDYMNWNQNTTRLVNSMRAKRGQKPLQYQNAAW